MRITPSAPPVVVGIAVVVGVVAVVVVGSSVVSSEESLVSSPWVGMAAKSIKHKTTSNNFFITRFCSSLESLGLA